MYFATNLHTNLFDLCINILLIEFWHSTRLNIRVSFPFRASLFWMVSSLFSFFHIFEYSSVSLLKYVITIVKNRKLQRKIPLITLCLKKFYYQFQMWLSQHQRYLFFFNHFFGQSPQRLGAEPLLYIYNNRI